MPKRPKSHQIGDKAWCLFENIIPTQWITREKVKDYGIDGEVEIFDDSDNSTGLLFLVQSKGTSRDDSTKSSEFYLSLDALYYYRSFDLPVLLVRPHLASQNIYIKWAHEIDPYYCSEDSKYVKVKFNEECMWTEQTPKMILEMVKAFRYYKSPRLSLPLEFGFEFNDEIVFSIPIEEIKSIIRRAGVSLSHIISFSSSEPTSSMPRIRITDNLLQIKIAGLSLFNLHITDENKLFGNSIDKIKRFLPHDILVGISIALHRLGHDTIASEIAYQHILSSNLWDNYAIAFEIMDCLSHTRKIDKAIKLAEEILERCYDKFPYQIYALPAFYKTNLTQEEFKMQESLLLKAIEKAKKNDFIEEAGICHYNLGNLYAYCDENRKAFHHYRLAAKYVPEYKKREYFWKEMGSILFHLKRFQSAETSYKYALELGAESRVIALRADTLIFCGKYEEARSLFEDYENNVNQVDAEWKLKKMAIELIMDELDTKIQKRNSPLAKKLADVERLESVEATKRIKESLKTDAICDKAWFYKGVLNFKNGEYSNAAISFIISAAIQPMNVDTWVNAILCTFICPEVHEMLQIILPVAYQYNKERFVNAFANKISEQPEDMLSKEKKAEIINLITKYSYELGKQETNPPTIRFINQNGTYKVITSNN